MPRTIVVGMAALDIGKMGDIVTTLGLGSCIGVTLYDPVTRIGGLAHVMLPKCASPATERNRAKFADTALADLYQMLIKAGATGKSLQAKMAGGAHMFSKVMSQDVIKVGQRNADACREILRGMGIPLRVEETGGAYGRTIELNTMNGDLTIKTIGHGTKVV
jgi:chemotaxis protein CheD